MELAVLAVGWHYKQIQIQKWSVERESESVTLTEELVGKTLTRTRVRGVYDGLSAPQWTYKFMVLGRQTVKMMSSHNYISDQASHTSHTRNPILRLFSFLANITVGRCLFPTVSGPSAMSRIDGPTEGSVMLEPAVCIDLKEESGEEKGQRGCLQCRQRRCPYLFPTASGSSAPTRFDGLFEGSVIGEHSVRVQEVSDKEERERTSMCFPVSVTTVN